MSQTLLSLALVFAFASVVIIVQTSAGHLFARGDRAKRVNRRLAMFEAGLNREQVYARLTRAQITVLASEIRGVTSSPFAINLWVSPDDPGARDVDR